MNIASWCTRIIRWSFPLLFILVPLILTQWNYELFEYNKMMLTYGITVIIVGAWLIKMIAQKEISIRRTPLDIPIALFFVSQLVSSLFSMDPHVSWFGYYSRFNGGMLSIISYILLYYAFVSHWSGEISHLLKLTLASATVVALYAALEHYGHSISCLLFMGKFGVDCWVQDVQNRVFATLGQPNWLAAYLVALLPIAIALFLQKAKKTIASFFKPNAFRFLLLTILFFAVLLFTKSRSGLIAFAVADLVFWAILFWKTAQKKSLLLPFGMCHVAFIIIIFFTGTNIDLLDKYITWESWQARLHKTTSVTKSPAAAKTDTLLTTGGTESGVIRKYVWEGAIAAWKRSTKTILIGTGTETFAFAFYQNKPKAHNLTSEWDFLYNKAHNEYLNYLGTTGILGLGSYLLFIGVFIFWFFKFSKKEILSSALFAGWISILITNFFGFSVVIMQLFLFLFPAFIFASTDRQHAFIRRLDTSVSVSRLLYIFVVVLFLFLFYTLGQFWWADTMYNKGYQYNKAGRLVEAENFLSAAITHNSGEPVYHDEQSVVLGQLAVAQIDAHDATLAAVLAKKSLEESDIAVATSPNNVNFWKSRTKIFYAFSSFDPAFTKAAIEALQHALILAPTDPKVMYNLAILYGKDGDNQKAIDTLKATIALKPNYRDAYAAVVIFYKEVKQPNLARTTMEEYLNKVDPNDADFQKQLTQL